MHKIIGSNKGRQNENSDLKSTSKFVHLLEIESDNVKIYHYKSTLRLGSRSLKKYQRFLYTLSNDFELYYVD